MTHLKVTAHLHLEPMFRMSGARISTASHSHGVHRYTALPTSQRTYSMYSLKILSLMLFAKMTDVIYKNRTRHTNTPRDHHAGFSHVTAGKIRCSELANR